MTAFTSSDLPGGIYAPTNIAQLNVWANQVSQFNNPTASYTEAQNTGLLFHHISPQLRIPDGRLVIVCRNVYEMDEDATKLSLPIWKRVKAFSDTLIPAGFKITG